MMYVSHCQLQPHLQPLKSNDELVEKQENSRGAKTKARILTVGECQKRKEERKKEHVNNKQKPLLAPFD
jgi:hypothetical protein